MFIFLSCFFWTLVEIEGTRDFDFDANFFATQIIGGAKELVVLL